MINLFKINYFVSVSDNQGKIIYEDLYYVEPVISKVGKNTIMVTVGRGDFWISTVIVQGKV